MTKRIRFIPLVLLLAFVLIPAWAMAGTGSVEGTVQGFHCVMMGKTCPVGKEDPVIAAERVFVVLTSAGNHYFVPNLDRAILARHVAQRVRVSGDINSKYKSIKAKTFEVWKNGKWKTVWSQAMQDEINKELEVGT